MLTVGNVHEVNLGLEAIREDEARQPLTTEFKRMPLSMYVHEFDPLTVTPAEHNITASAPAPGVEIYGFIAITYGVRGVLGVSPVVVDATHGMLGMHDRDYGIFRNTLNQLEMDDSIIPIYPSRDIQRPPVPQPEAARQPVNQPSLQPLPMPLAHGGYFSLARVHPRRR